MTTDISEMPPVFSSWNQNSFNHHTQLVKNVSGILLLFSRLLPLVPAWLADPTSQGSKPFRKKKVVHTNAKQQTRRLLKMGPP